MDGNRIEGAARNVAGKAQEGFGNLIGDAKTQAEGGTREMAGQVQQAYGEAKDNAGEIAESAASAIKERPLAAMAIVAAVAFLLGRVTATTRPRYYG